MVIKYSKKNRKYDNKNKINLRKKNYARRHKILDV